MQDEPVFKSTFSVRVIRPAGDDYIALSNMPVAKEHDNVPTHGLTTVQVRHSFLLLYYLLMLYNINYTIMTFSG